MDSLEEINIIKGILNARCRDGATVEDIADDFTEFIGMPWKMADKSFDEIKHYMESIDGAYSMGASNASAKWYINSKKTVHIKKLIQKQKRSTERSPVFTVSKHIERSPISMPSKHIVIRQFPNKSVNSEECFFKDNYAYKYKHYRVRNASECSDYIADTVLNNTQLLGDDFFLSILSSELNISLARKLPHQSGLCKSGLSIRGAISMLQSIAYIKTPSIIINVGSIDIMHGRDLVEMRLDYKELVDLCVKRNIRPIITTLAPLANTSHYHLRDMREKLILFNNHLLDHYYHKHHVINLWSRMTTPRGRTIFEYFELESTYVTGSNHPHVLWNQTGRQKILEHIYKHL